MYTCQYVNMSKCLYVNMSICKFVYMSICICIYVYMYEEVKSKHHSAWVLACAFSVDCK